MVRKATNYRNQCLLHCRILSVYFTLQDTIVFHFLTPHSKSVQFQGTKMICSRSSEMVELPHPRASTGDGPKYVRTKYMSLGQVQLLSPFSS